MTSSEIGGEDQPQRFPSGTDVTTVGPGLGSVRPQLIIGILNGAALAIGGGAAAAIYLHYSRRGHFSWWWLAVLALIGPAVSFLVFLWHRARWRLAIADGRIWTKGPGRWRSWKLDQLALASVRRDFLYGNTDILIVATTKSDPYAIRLGEWPEDWVEDVLERLHIDRTSPQVAERVVVGRIRSVPLDPVVIAVYLTLVALFAGAALSLVTHSLS